MSSWRRAVVVVVAVIAASTVVGAPTAGAGPQDQIARNVAEPAIEPPLPSRTAAGNAFVCHVGVDGSLGCWGSDHYFTLGRGRYVGSEGRYPAPVLTTGTPLEGKHIAEVVAGRNHACALADDGTVACWGANFGRLLGSGVAGEHSFTPLGLETTGTVLEGERIVQLAAGGRHTCARTATGLVACWGANDAGQLGRGTTSTYGDIAAVTTAGTPLAGRSVVDLSLGSEHSCALTSDGVVACWGSRYGTGTGLLPPATVPVAPSTGPGSGLAPGPIADVAAGTDSTCVAHFAGDVACWGKNRDGQLGDGTDIWSLLPVRVRSAGTALEGARVVELAAGSVHFCARTADDELVCWGANFAGQLGDGTTTDRPTPVRAVLAGTVLDGVAIDEIDLGFQLTCASAADGTQACWGTNTSGTLGDGSWTTSIVPVSALQPGRPTEVVAAPAIGEVTVRWTPPLADPPGPWNKPTGYAVIVEVDGQRRAPVDVGLATSYTATGLASGVPVRFLVAARSWGMTGPPGTSATTTARGSTGRYVPIVPCRVLDTRVAGGRFGTNEKRTVRVRGGGAAFAAQGGRAGGCAVPSSATAVEATLSAVDAAGSSFAKVWPAGDPLPTATFLNVVDGASTTSTGTLRLGPNDLTLRHAAGASHYVVDVQGYFVDGRADSYDLAAQYVPITPCRAVDTRKAGGALAAKEQRTYAVAGPSATSAIPVQGGASGGCGIPDEAVAVEAAWTTTTPRDGYLRVWPADRPMPNATFTSGRAGRSITSTGSVALAAGTGPDLAVRPFGSTSHLVVDVLGYYVPWSPTTSGPRTELIALRPCRLVDTRQSGGPLADGQRRTYRVSGSASMASQGGAPGGCGVPAGAAAAEVTVSAIDPAAPGYLRGYPAGTATPNATILNWSAGAISNSGSVPLAATAPGAGQLTLRGYGGATNVVVDVLAAHVPVGVLS